MTRIGVDTNILIYAEGIEFVPADRPKIEAARRLMHGLLAAQDRPVLALQALAELYRLLVTKARLPSEIAHSRIRRLMGVSETVETTEDIFDHAVALARDHGFQIFDAIILAAAAEARCDLLLSEDMQDGFAWRGVTVTNPFGASPDRRIADYLK